MDPAVRVEGAGSRQGFYQIPKVAVEANCFVFPVFLLSSGPGGRKGWYSYKRTILHAPGGGLHGGSGGAGVRPGGSSGAPWG